MNTFLQHLPARTSEWVAGGRGGGLIHNWLRMLNCGKFDNYKYMIAQLRKLKFLVSNISTNAAVNKVRGNYELN